MSRPRGSDEGVISSRDSGQSSINQRAKSPPRVVQSTQFPTQFPTQTQVPYCELYLPPQKRKLRQLGLSCSRDKDTPLDQFGPQRPGHFFATTCGNERCRRVSPIVDFGRDTIIIPLDILNLPETVQIANLDRIQRLCVVSSGNTRITRNALNRLRTATSVIRPLMLQLDLSTPKVPSEPVGIVDREPSTYERVRGDILIAELELPDIFSEVRYVRVVRADPSFKKRMKHKARSVFDTLHRNILGPHDMELYLA